MINLTDFYGVVKNFIIEDLKADPNYLAEELKNWDKLFPQLKVVGLDEFGDAIGGYFETHSEYIPYVCWKFGAGLLVDESYWGGNEVYTVYMPDNEDEYRQNLKEADAWWQEVYGL